MVITLDQVKELVGDHREMSRGYIFAHCPWHSDESPSLLIFEDGWYKCLAECEGSGHNGTGPIDRLYEELSNPGVVRPHRNGHKAPLPTVPTKLDDIESLVWKAHADLKANDEYKWYPKQRGIDDRIEVAKLGWWNGWITVPIFGEDSSIQGVYLRSTPPQEKVTGARFIQPIGQHPMLYCPDWRLWKASPSVAVVYGMMDALVISSLRFPVVTTTGGSKSFDPSWMDHWRKPVYIFPDAEGDDKAAADLAAELGWRARIIRLPYDDEVRDPADFAKSSVGRKDELMRLVGSHL